MGTTFSPLRGALHDRSIRVHAILLFAIVSVFVTASAISVRSIDLLLDRDAENIARQWADTFAVHVQTIDHVLSGGSLTPEERDRLQELSHVGGIFRFKLFAPDGTLRVISDELDKTGIVDTLQDHQPDLARKILAGKNHVESYEGHEKANRPDYYAEAYVPLVQAGKIKGVVEVYVDQTARRAVYGATLWRTIWMTLALTVLVFAYTFYTTLLLRRERRSDAQVRYLSRFDALTGVANRTAFNERLALALGGRREGDGDIAVLMVDLDGFKAVNDSNGHQIGDALLQEIAESLGAQMRDGDLLSRLGGDEFAILQTGIYDNFDSRTMADRLINCIREIREVNGKPVRISASVGIANARDLPAGSASEELLKRADVALYQAKEKGRDRAIMFKPGMESIMRARNALRQRIRNAVEQDQLVVLYQPQHDAADGSLCGFEALVRLPGEGGEMISPADFIPIAEEMRLMGKLGESVLERAATEAMNWPDNLHVSVNLSAQQFENDIVAVVKGALQRSGLPAERLELEITESLFISDTECVEKQLRKLKAMGVRIAMDDFGTGYSSMSYLWQFPFDKLKVDRSCFAQLHEPADADNVKRVVAVLETIGALGKAMDLRITAEGIETLAQRTYAQAAGYHEIQGYLYARPMPREELSAHILRDFSDGLAAVHDVASVSPKQAV